MISRFVSHVVLVKAGKAAREAIARSISNTRWGDIALEADEWPPDLMDASVATAKIAGPLVSPGPKRPNKDVNVGVVRERLDGAGGCLRVPRDCVDRLVGVGGSSGSYDCVGNDDFAR